MVLNFYFIKNTEIFKVHFLENKEIAVCEFFTDCTGVDCLSISKFLGKSMFRKNVTKSSKKKFRNLFWGPSLPGVAKFQKLLRWIDRGSPDLFNGEKILALRRT